MDVFNRPPSVSEDTLQYVLYPTDELSDKSSVTTLAVVMQDYVNSLLPDMQWHRDTFQLKVVPNPSGIGYALEGTMRTGDCVDDEWCAVWLLREISERWDVVISAFDSDGEFLLIEAADYLPSWVNPSNAENRVWIYKSHLQLIPLAYVSAPAARRKRAKYRRAKDSDDELDENDELEDYLDAQDAVRLVRDPLTETRAPAEVEAVPWHRISKYPGAARTHIHYTKARVPKDIAKALAVNPSLVQKAVEAFYTRDAFQLRAAHRMSRFPPEPSVLTTVRMTRTAYAQLVGQKFYPPKVFGRWLEQEGTAEWRWRDVGMKIACGCEMLYQESGGRQTASESSEDVLTAQSRIEALQRNPDFRKYVENLQSTGYFREEREGSQLWKTMYDRAAAAFVEARRDDDSHRPSFASQVDAAVVGAGEMDTFSSQPEDSDEWLNVSADDFDMMLQQMSSRPSQTGARGATVSEQPDADMLADDADSLAQTQASRLQDLAKKVEQFVEGEGDLQGARFADESLSDEEPSDDEESREHSDEDDIALGSPTDPEQRAARREAMNTLVPGIDPSDYGKMPAAYYSNSQRVTRTTLGTEMREDLPDNTANADRQPETRNTIRPPLLPRDEYDGADSDDETDEEDVDDDEDQPQLVGDVEIDMEEEQEEFLEFARHALGVSDEQWNAIVDERRARGAFVPAHGVTRIQTEKKNPDIPIDVHGQGSTAKKPTVGTRTNVDSKLDSFEAVMHAMDAEIARARAGEHAAPPTNFSSGNSERTHPRAEIGGDADIEAAMEAELEAELKRGSDDEGPEDALGQEQVDYNLIKNFLESFKSQAGQSGPVSNLAGRLQPGWKLPRDES